MKKLNKISIVVISLIVIFSCVSVNKIDDQNENIIGAWALNKRQINYPELIFKKDNTCIFTSMGDTIYRFKYELEKDKLILEDIRGTIKKNHILKLTKSELVFEALWENKTKQEYIKK